jgi:hypothetical protein
MLLAATKPLLLKVKYPFEPMNIAPLEFPFGDMLQMLNVPVFDKDIQLLLASLTFDNAFAFEPVAITVAYVCMERSNTSNVELEFCVTPK